MLPNENDDGGSLRHGPHQATNADHTQEDEENLLTARHGTFPRNHGGGLASGRNATTFRLVLSAQRRDTTINLSFIHAAAGDMTTKHSEQPLMELVSSIFTRD